MSEKIPFKTEWTIKIQRDGTWSSFGRYDTTRDLNKALEKAKSGPNPGFKIRVYREETTAQLIQEIDV